MCCVWGSACLIFPQIDLAGSIAHSFFGNPTLLCCVMGSEVFRLNAFVFQFGVLSRCISVATCCVSYCVV